MGDAVESGTNFGRAGSTGVGGNTGNAGSIGVTGNTGVAGVAGVAGNTGNAGNTRNALYLIPYPRFSSQHRGVGGHIVHAYSITRALAKAGFATRILTEEEIPLLQGEDGNPELVSVPLAKNDPLRRIMWGRRFLEVVRKELSGHPSKTSQDHWPTNKPEFVYIRYSVGFMNWLPALKRICGDIPLVLEVNSFGSQRRSWLARVEGRFLRSADLLIAISDVVWQGIHDRWGDALSGKTHVVTNGVDPGRFPTWMEASERSRGDVIRIGYTGLMETWYDLDLVAEGFLDASRRWSDSDQIKSTQSKPTPRLELHFYGDGPYLQTLRQRYKNETHIMFHGAKPYTSMPDVMNHLDLLVNAESAAKAYTSPIKLMEYMASGRPVLSARTPQCEAMLGADDKGGERGWIYELGSKDSFTDRLLEWLETPDDEIRARVVKARTFVEEHHTWDQRLAQILALAGIPPADRP